MEDREEMKDMKDMKDMSYCDLVSKNIDNVYQAGIATKIMQHMGRIRNSSDVNQARRWVMELLQNARDVAYPDKPVQVKIVLDEKQLKFSHTGRPFRVKDILSIVNQVSSKVDDEETVGQFGTGFVTTFQLSEQVELEGVLKDEGLPYKPFSVSIDRRGFTKDEILFGIERAMEEIKKVDLAPSLENYDSNAFHTTFTYVLDQERSREIARIGMEDLQETIFFVLLFSEKIASVELVFQLPDLHKSVSYSREKREVLKQLLVRTEFLRLTNQDGIRQYDYYEICSMERDGMTLAAAYSSEKGFLALPERCARLFVDFPLIGSEKFCFPMVVNSLEFHPNEPRSGISLVDQATSIDALKNKELIKKAVSMYKDFLAEASSLYMMGLQHIIAIPAFEGNKEWSESWVKCNIYKSLYRYIASQQLFETSKGILPLNSSNVYLLKGDTPEELEGLKELLIPVKDFYYPLGNADWYHAFSGYELQEEKVFSLEKLVAEAEDFLHNRLQPGGEEKEASCLDVQGEKVVACSAGQWCSNIYHLAMKNEKLALCINAGEVAIFPSQRLENGRIWNLRKINEIWQDPGIPEEIKDVTELLDKLEPGQIGTGMERCSLRENLLHQDFAPEGLKGVPVYDWSRLSAYLVTKTNEKFRVSNYSFYASYYNELWEKAWLQMTACGPDCEMYDLISQFYRGDIPAYHQCNMPLGESVWFNSYHGLLRRCIQKITNYAEVQQFGEQVLGKDTDVYQWLNLFYQKWLCYQYTNEDMQLAIYASQEGRFAPKYSLRRDGIKARELKKIAFAFSGLSEQCNFYKKLLHEKIQEEEAINVTYTDRDVAMEINSVVTQLLAQQNLSDAKIEYQEACSMLLGWIQNHTQEAKEYFPAYSDEEGQMKLLTPKAAVLMQQKVNKLEQIMELIACDDEENSIEMIQKLLEQRTMLENLQLAENAAKNWECVIEEESDVVLDGAFLEELGWKNLDEDSFRQKCREIGVLGEKYVFDSLKEYYLRQGLEVAAETADEIVLQGRKGKVEKREGAGETIRTVTLQYPDSGNYHQAGWDICITDSIGNGIREFVEVKTHTQKSYLRGQVSLSNEQMKKAIREGAHYHVLMAVYDYKQRKGQEIIAYTGFLENIATGKLKNSREGYVFYN